jgi:hypothetical protein
MLWTFLTLKMEATSPPETSISASIIGPAILNKREHFSPKSQ